MDEQQMEYTLAGQPDTAYRVLVIDDNPLILECLRRILRHRGYRVRTVDNPEVGFLACAPDAFAPDVVLMDLNLQGARGDELARQIWQRWPGLPVVLMTGYSAPALEAELAGLPFTACLGKPFTLQELDALFQGLWAPALTRRA